MKMRCLSFVSMLVCCGATYSVTFEEAVVAAYNNNPGWFASQTDKKIADESFLQSKMMFLPNVNATAGASRSKAERDQFGYKSDSKETGTRMGIVVSQNLFNGFSTVNSMKAADNSAKAAYHKLKFEEQDLIVKVLEAYSGIWVARQKVTALKKKEENLKNTLASQGSSLEAGVGTPSEVALANANYQKAIFEKINAETELFSAESDFEKLTGLKADDKIELPHLNIELPKNLEKLIEQSLACNHSILYYKLSEQSATDSLNATRGRLAPSCDLRLEAGRNLNKQQNINRSDNSYIASLEVNIPIFANSPNSGNSYSAIAIANQQALKAKFSAQNALLEIKKDCVVNWNAHISAKAMIKSSRSAVKSAELSSSNNLEESALGLKSNTDVWVKENQLLESRIDLANSKRQKLVTAIKLVALTGNLSLNSVLKKQ